MRLLRRYRLLCTIIAVYATYGALVLLLPGEPRGNAVRALALVLSGFGLAVYWRPALKTLLLLGRAEERHPYAVCLLWFCMAINKNVVMGLWWRLSGQPYWIINNWLFDSWLVDVCVGLFIAVTVPNLFGKDVPPNDKLQMGSLWLIVFALASYLVLLQPNLRPLADWARPYLDSKYVYRDPD